MKILLACQKSGYLRELLRAAGHDAWTCDLQPAEDGSPYHLLGDALKPAYNAPFWDCMIAMPECRNLCSSGQHWNDKPGQRTTQEVEEAARFFMALAYAPIEHKCIENSVGIMSTRYRKPDQIVQPHWFGDDASKSTCFWMEEFPLLESLPWQEHIKPRMICPKCMGHSSFSVCGNMLCLGWNKEKCLPRWGNQTDSGQNRLGPSATRSADRARTYPGIARALAAAVEKL